MVTYFSWWYGQGMLKFWEAILIMTEKVYSFFSVKVLLRTLFAPWKRDNYSVEMASLQTRLAIMLDNLVSRIIGFIIRFITLIMGLVVTILFFILMIIVLVIWLSLPIIVLFLIINGLRLVING